MHTYLERRMHTHTHTRTHAHPLSLSLVKHIQPVNTMCSEIEEVCSDEEIRCWKQIWTDIGLESRFRAGVESEWFIRLGSQFHWSGKEKDLSPNDFSSIKVRVVIWKDRIQSEAERDVQQKSKKKCWSTESKSCIQFLIVLVASERCIIWQCFRNFSTHFAAEVCSFKVYPGMYWREPERRGLQESSFNRMITHRRILVNILLAVEGNLRPKRANSFINQ